MSKFKNEEGANLTMEAPWSKLVNLLQTHQPSLEALSVEEKPPNWQIHEY